MADDDLDIGGDSGASGGKKKLIIIIALALVLLGAVAGGVYYFFFSGDDIDSVEEYTPSVYFEFDPAFTVDFIVDGKQRYLQLSLTVKSKDMEPINSVTLHMPLIRNSLVLLFSSQSFANLQTDEGKQALKQASVDAINKILEQETGEGGIDSVLFTNFVMQ